MTKCLQEHCNGQTFYFHLAHVASITLQRAFSAFWLCANWSKSKKKKLTKQGETTFCSSSNLHTTNAHWFTCSVNNTVLPIGYIEQLKGCMEKRPDKLHKTSSQLLFTSLYRKQQFDMRCTCRVTLDFFHARFQLPPAPPRPNALLRRLIKFKSSTTVDTNIKITTNTSLFISVDK